MSELMKQGIQLMGYGLIGVFSTLILFIVVICLLVKLFPYQEKPEE